MTEQPIFFEKDDKIYKAQINATLLNMTDSVPEGVVVKDVATRGNNKYGILLLSASSKWDKEFEVERLDEAEF